MKRKNGYARQKRWRAKKPWTRYVEWAQRRCGDANHHHGKKGIKVRLTNPQAKTLWERDGAAMMKTPSLDRKDSTLDYTFDNCRFIEKSLNERLPHMTPEAIAAVDAEAVFR